MIQNNSLSYQSHEILDSCTQIKHIQCSNHNTIQLLCINQYCQQQYIICQNQNCKCLKSHKNCKTIFTQSLLDTIKNKKQQANNNYQNISHQIIRIYDQLIDNLSKQRQKMEQYLKNSALTLSELNFINKINEGVLNQLSKSQILQVVSDSKKNRRLNANLIYMELSQKWNKKQQQLKNLFNFSSDKYFINFNNNTVLIQGFNLLQICSQLKSIQKEGIKGMSIRNWNHFQYLNESILDQIKKFIDLQDLNLYRSFFSNEQIISLIKQLSKLKSIGFDKIQKISSNITQVFDFQKIVKFSLSQDIQYSWKKKYVQEGFKNLNVHDYHNFSKFLEQNPKKQILQRLQYFQTMQPDQKIFKQLLQVRSLDIIDINNHLPINFYQILPNPNLLLNLSLNSVNLGLKSNPQIIWPLFHLLKKLALISCYKLTGKDIFYITEHCRNLQTLLLDKSLPQKISYFSIGKLTKLKQLSLQMKYQQFEKFKSKQQQEEIKQIKSLFIENNETFQTNEDDQTNFDKFVSQTQKKAINWLSKLKQLEFLNIKNNISFDYSWLWSIKKLCKLQTIILNGFTEHQQMFLSLKKLPKLDTIMIYNQYSSNFIKNLKTFKNLKRVLIMQQMKKEDLKIFCQGSFPNLQFLYFNYPDYAKFEDKICESILSFKKLKLLKAAKYLKRGFMDKLQSNGVLLLDKPKQQPVHIIKKR